MGVVCTWCLGHSLQVRAEPTHWIGADSISATQAGPSVRSHCCLSTAGAPQPDFPGQALERKYLAQVHKALGPAGSGRLQEVLRTYRQDGDLEKALAVVADLTTERPEDFPLLQGQ